MMRDLNRRYDEARLAAKQQAVMTAGQELQRSQTLGMEGSRLRGSQIEQMGTLGTEFDVAMQELRERAKQRRAQTRIQQAQLGLQRQALAQRQQQPEPESPIY